MSRLLLLLLSLGWAVPGFAAEPTQKIPRFSVENMDRTVLPGVDFFRYAAGTWLRNNPVPDDKSRWSGFEELQERNWQLIQSILEDCAEGRAGKGKPAAQVGPSATWLFMDEREDSMNDGEMVVGMSGYPDRPQAWKLVDYPASYHNNAGGLSFADGHSEIKKWTDPRTMPALTKGQLIPLNVASPNNQDALWLMERSTRKVN